MPRQTEEDEEHHGRASSGSADPRTARMKAGTEVPKRRTPRNAPSGNPSEDKEEEDPLGGGPPEEEEEGAGAAGAPWE